MIQTELAWAAGFVDGEGSFLFKAARHKNDKRSYPSISLTIHQVDKRALVRVRKALGVGRVDGPYGPYSGNRQPHYQFVLGDFEGTQAAIAMLWKYLGPVKRLQAKLVLIKARALARKVSKDKHE